MLPSFSSLDLDSVLSIFEFEAVWFDKRISSLDLWCRSLPLPLYQGTQGSTLRKGWSSPSGDSKRASSHFSADALTGRESMFVTHPEDRHHAAFPTPLSSLLRSLRLSRCLLTAQRPADNPTNHHLCSLLYYNIRSQQYARAENRLGAWSSIQESSGTAGEALLASSIPSHLTLHSR